MTHPIPQWMVNPVRSPEPTPDEHLAWALEFQNPECGREHLRAVGLEILLDEFERLSEEEANG